MSRTQRGQRALKWHFVHFHILPCRRCRIHAHVGCEHGAVPVRTETCPCHTGHEGSGTRSPEPPTPWHLLGGSSKPPSPTRVFTGVCQGKRSCRRRRSRVSEARAFGNLARFQPHAGEEEFVHRSPSGLPCVLVHHCAGITGVCSHPEPLKTGAPRNRSSEASASACLCVHRVACKCLCKVHTYGYLGTGCACTRVCEC